MEQPSTDKRKEPTLAPGLEDDELYADATPLEIERGDYTQVVRLSWDENANGSDESPFPDE